MCSVAQAKSLYVNGSSGNDSVSYANNSQSTPWRTLGRALWGTTNIQSPNAGEAARAGDTVNVAAGIYSAQASNVRYSPAFNPTNSGTASAPLVIQAVGRVELRSTNGNGAVMGMYERNYIHWRGHFFIDETYAVPHADTGPVVLWQTNGSVVDGCEVQAHEIPYQDNHNAVRFEFASNSTVRNCLLNGIVGPGGELHHNSAGVMLYYSNNITIENNEVTNCGAGIFPKGGDNYSITIRYNRVRGCLKGLRNSYTAPSQGTNRMYQNIVEDGVGTDSMGIQIAENSYNWTIANNTIVNFGNGIYFGPTNVFGNVRVANNITANTNTAVNGWESSGTQAPGPGHNIYFNPGHWAWSSREYSGLAAWLLAATSDLASVVSNPGFVNLAGRDYHLTTASVGRLLGVDILDLNGNGSTSDVVPVGAYVRGDEVIGRTTVAAGPIPSPPTNATAQ
jgi:parallel beta-helix repeat protein